MSFLVQKTLLAYFTLNLGKIFENLNTLFFYPKEPKRNSSVEREKNNNKAANGCKNKFAFLNGLKRGENDQRRLLVIN